MKIKYQNYPLSQNPEFIIEIDNNADIHMEIKQRMSSPNQMYRYEVVDDSETTMVKPRRKK
jgi:hypothetical protein